MARLLRLALPYKWLLVAASILSLISSGINLALPLLGRSALDRVLQTHSVAALDLLAGAIIGLVLISGLINFGQFYTLAFAGSRIVYDVRRSVYAHLLQLPVAYFDQTRSGELASRLSNDASQIQTSLTSDVAGLLSNLVTLTGGTAVLFWLDWRLTLVVLFLLMAVMSWFVFFGRRLRKLMREALDALSEATGTMTEALGSVRLVKAFARESYEESRADEQLGKVMRLGVRTSIWEGLMGSVAFVGFIILMLGVAWYGGRNVLTGRLTAGSLFAFFGIVVVISGPMGSLASLYTRLQRAVGAADRLFEMQDETPEIPDQPDAVGFPEGSPRVDFRDVAFQYLPDNPVLEGFSLELPAGKVTALVGASGSGKTTVSALLYRFYEPQAGTIEISGVPVGTIRRGELRQRVGIVPQDPVLFNGTIWENIRYGRLDATDAEIEQAARAANVEEFVLGFSDGYQTLVGERGVTLSGGQRQRVAIARAVLKNPRILILDEATSALDTKSEALVREALERLMVGRTTLVIAHRLTTVQGADQIAVLDHGKVVERGTHEQLLSLGGKYAELHRAGPEPLAALNEA